MKKIAPTLAALALVLPLLAAPGLAVGLEKSQEPNVADLAEAPELIAAPGHQASPEAVAALDSLLHRYSVFQLPTATLDRQVRELGQVRIHLGNQTFHLVLEPNDLRAEGYQELLMVDGQAIVQPPRPVSTFKGHLVGDSDSFVRFSVRPDHFEGYVKSSEDWIFIEPLSHYSGTARADAVVVYREADVRASAMGECGVTHLLEEAGDIGHLGAFSDPLVSGSDASHVRRTLQVAADADGQLFNRYGNPGVFNFQSDVLNRVDGIYRNQLNIQLSIVFQQAWSSVSGDPYTSLDAGTTLNQLRNWWEANRSDINRDAVHLFSGKDFNSGTIGIAWVGVICNRPDLSYGLSQDLQNSALNGRLTAHEIGHNLSAQHDDQIGCSGVNCNGTGPIMCSFIQTSGPNSFSSCSKSSISNHVHNNGFCM